MSLKDKIKIPREYIDFYITNMDHDYEFEINEETSMDEVHLSREASSILMYLFLKFYANDEQRQILREILQIPQSNTNNYEKNSTDTPETVQIKEIVKLEEKETIFKKISKFIQKLFEKK